MIAWQEELDRLRAELAREKERAESAEARVKELEAEIHNLRAISEAVKPGDHERTLAAIAREEMEKRRSAEARPAKLERDVKLWRADAESLRSLLGPTIVSLRAMREWHRTYHGADRCVLCIAADNALSTPGAQRGAPAAGTASKLAGTTYTHCPLCGLPTAPSAAGTGKEDKR